MGRGGNRWVVWLGGIKVAVLGRRGTDDIESQFWGGRKCLSRGWRSRLGSQFWGVGEHLGPFLGGGQIRVLVLGTGGIYSFCIVVLFLAPLLPRVQGKQTSEVQHVKRGATGLFVFFWDTGFFQLTGRESVALRDSYFPSSEQTTSNEVSSNKVRLKEEVPGGFLYIFHEGAKRCNYEIPSSPIRSKRANKVKCGETKQVPRRDFCIFHKAG